MLFNSLQFLIFFPCVVILYWILPAKWRNGFLLIASYYFYMNWEPGFGLLLAGESIVTWGGARLISKYNAVNPLIAKRILIATIFILLALLFVFKYLNFVAEEIHSGLVALGIEMNVPEFDILLPVGISFFTFQAVGYIIDVRRNSVPAERSPFSVMLFLAFFPQLVAGPIERAKNLLPQFHTPHKFSGHDIIAGLELMALGYFMKLCVAENAAEYVDAVYNNLHHHSGLNILMATIFFCFQIFADFGGYSLIAIGVARCMGFRLTQNFRQPYLATSIRDFWRRWHVSLSRWLTDYIYIPLGGNRKKPARHYFNIFTTLFLSGIWHGADYTFIAWGTYHGTLQTLQAAWHKKSKFHLPENFLSNALKIFWTFILVMLGRVFFRANSLDDAGYAFKKIFTEPGELLTIGGIIKFLTIWMMILILMAFEFRHEWLEMNRADTPQGDLPAVRSGRNLYRSALVTTFLIVLILLFGNFRSTPFIYFQF